MLYNVTMRFTVDLNVDDINTAQELINELTPDQLITMSESCVNIDVDAI